MKLENRTSIGPIGLGVFLAVCLGLPATAPAAPGILSQIPLFLATGAEPNVFFVLDDSGSMGSDVLKSRGATAAHPVTTDPVTGEVLYDVDGNMVSAMTREDQILEHCVGYNVMAYDPTVTYRPWAGEDRAGNAYGDLTLTTARENPYDPNPTSTVDISDRLYFPWTDCDGDKDYNDEACPANAVWGPGECPRPDPADFGGDIDAADCPASGCVAVSSLDAAGQTNFANWYSYYRTREHVQKRVVSSVIDSASVRMGLTSLHNHNSVATPVSDMSDTASTSDCGSSNKECLMQRLFELDTGGLTPLRRALDEAGHYFETDGFFHEYLGNVDDPILSAVDHGDCQQNFVILISDGFWNGPWPGMDTAGQILMSHGDADSDNTHSANPPYDPPWDGGAQADVDPLPSPLPTCPTSIASFLPNASATDTLADIAMHYYETDLDLDLANNVGPVPGVDENTQQHLSTFMIAFGIDGSLTNDPPNRTDDFDWPPICGDAPEAVDDMRHAAWNSRGAFLSAGSPSSLGDAITAAVVTTTDRVATAAAAFNTNSLSTNTLIFLAKGDSSDWSGDLLAYDAVAVLASLAANATDTDPTNDGKITIAPEWSAADELDALSNTDALDRVVLTRGASGGGVFAATDDTSWPLLSTALTDDLKIDPTGAPGSEDAAKGRLDYLKGDRSCEVGGTGTCIVDGLDKSLRERGSRLGDIFGGAPLVVGIPTRSWPLTPLFTDGNGDTFNDFKAAQSLRDEVVYIGANDGMLHGFDTTTGQEVLAYMPTSLISNGLTKGYHWLSDPAYTHRFYVDRTPTINNAWVAMEWRTVAVGGLGAGGRGLYALDINDPDNFSTADPADILLWEFTASDDAELGLTMSEPTIVRMDDDRWAVVVGSGYNDTGAKDAHLFIIYLDGPTGPGGAWTLNTDYRKIPVPEALATIANPNGLSSPKAADLDGNGTTDRVYAGDLFGNLWAFDVSDASPANWGVAGSAPLFTAKIGDVRQPITVEPAIAKHPAEPDAVGNQPNVMVYFGTGQYLTSTDLATTDTQSFYGIWDRGSSSLNRTNLQMQGFDGDFSGNVVVTDNTVDWSTKFGWYLDLPDSGERVVTDPLLRGGIVFFNSMIPSTNLCQGGGSGFLYAVDMVNGGAPDFATFDFDGSGVVDEADVATGTSGRTENPSRVSFVGEVPTGSVYLDNKEYTGSSDGTIQVRDVFEIQGLTGRLSWQELTTF